MLLGVGVVMGSLLYLLNMLSLSVEPEGLLNVPGGGGGDGLPSHHCLPPHVPPRHQAQTGGYHFSHFC